MKKGRDSKVFYTQLDLKKFAKPSEFCILIYLLFSFVLILECTCFSRLFLFLTTLYLCMPNTLCSQPTKKKFKDLTENSDLMANVST